MHFKIFMVLLSAVRKIFNSHNIFPSSANLQNPHAAETLIRIFTTLNSNLQLKINKNRNLTNILGFTVGYLTNTLTYFVTQN